MTVTMNDYDTALRASVSPTLRREFNPLSRFYAEALDNEAIETGCDFVIPGSECHRVAAVKITCAELGMPHPKRICQAHAHCIFAMWMVGA